MKYFPESEREGLFPVGRLDKETEGFLLMTDDGAFCYRINTPIMKKEKTYVFYSRGEATEEKLRALCEGVDIGTREELPVRAVSAELIETCRLEQIAELIGENPAKLRESRKGGLTVSRIKMTITEGKKHQVRRMAMAVGLPVLHLERVSICGVPLDTRLARGEYRPLTAEEYEQLVK
jgi:16S rRNA pseudouridine516 synthase